MANRYDIDAARAAYDETRARDTAEIFWHDVANKLKRGVHGVRVKLGVELGWAAKLTRAKPCGVCGERFNWQAFVDGGRKRVCIECTSAGAVADATEGRR